MQKPLPFQGQIEWVPLNPRNVEAILREGLEAAATFDTMKNASRTDPKLLKSFAHLRLAMHSRAEALVQFVIEQRRCAAMVFHAMHVTYG